MLRSRSPSCEGRCGARAKADRGATPTSPKASWRAADRHGRDKATNKTLRRNANVIEEQTAGPNRLHQLSHPRHRMWVVERLSKHAKSSAE